MSDTQINDTDVVDGDDGPVITKLRQELRESQKQAKLEADRATEAESKVSKQLESQVKALVDGAGFPNLDVSIVMERIEGEATAETVAAALEAAGLSPQSAEGDEDEKVEEPKPDTGGASELGRRVAAAATGGAVKSLDDRLAGAESADEISAIMEEAGLTGSHSG